ncbi:hypothetical protein AAFF_G00012860 [Aldrovandia affinis]|uniref:Uncharacterized protein n=1 Tax=Aldrovandia affinis TaxID=143900 RepID=A0AAD7S6Z4_9TELE|nr:hypothetical protein AAFF_G00012860 [Aldrovandia affinis]
MIWPSFSQLRLLSRGGESWPGKRRAIRATVSAAAVRFSVKPLCWRRLLRFIEQRRTSASKPAVMEAPPPPEQAMSFFVAGVDVCERGALFSPVDLRVHSDVFSLGEEVRRVSGERERGVGSQLHAE